MPTGKSLPPSNVLLGQFRYLPLLFLFQLLHKAVENGDLKLDVLGHLWRGALHYGLNKRAHPSLVPTTSDIALEIRPGTTDYSFSHLSNCTNKVKNEILQKL